MKRIFGILILLLVLVLAACGSKATEGDKTKEENVAETKNEEAKVEEEKKETSFPEKSITMIVPHPAGGGTDATARALAHAAEKHLGQPIGVVNKPGGGGAIGMTDGAQQKADGYNVTMVTVELSTLRHLGLSPLHFEEYDPVAQINYDPGAIAVPIDAPYDTIEEFIAYVKDHPREIKMGANAPGAIWNLAAVSLEQAAGLEFNHVPFDGAAPTITALLGGHVDAAAASPAEFLAHVEAGSIKLLTVLSEERVDSVPDVPTAAESGFELSVGAWRGIAVPKGTPQEVIDVLQDAFLKAAEDEEFVSFMDKNGLGIVKKDAAGFLKVISDSDSYFSELIPTLNIQ
ncbi:tripartite tricarboxylate transporter substrate binding protein [bacterium LRH843]|nr:tripartite tricarboxylate transporter substrate binding protein [bacterium LRH843]